jgi:mycothiol synthase
MRDGERQIGEIALIGVLPAWRGRGLGRDLLRWGIQHLRERGVADLTLNAEARNDRALALYERSGFVRVQEWPRWAKEA